MASDSDLGRGHPDATKLIMRNGRAWPQSS